MVFAIGSTLGSVVAILSAKAVLWRVVAVLTTKTVL